MYNKTLAEIDDKGIKLEFHEVSFLHRKKFFLGNSETNVIMMRETFF